MMYIDDDKNWDEMIEGSDPWDSPGCEDEESCDISEEMVTESERRKEMK